MYDSHLGIHRPELLDNLEIYIKRFLNWTFPGLQFFYYDTDEELDCEYEYYVGRVYRAGKFLWASAELKKPNTKTRFIIAASHAAQLFQTPNATSFMKKNKLVCFHYNAFFKVMDVYQRSGVTQILLLQIPPVAVKIFGDNSIDTRQWEAPDIAELAKQNLDEKLKGNVAEASNDQEFRRLTQSPIGMDSYGARFRREVAKIPLDEKAQMLEYRILECVPDIDIDYDVEEP